MLMSVKQKMQAVDTFVKTQRAAMYVIVMLGIIVWLTNMTVTVSELHHWIASVFPDIHVNNFNAL